MRAARAAVILILIAAAGLAAKEPALPLQADKVVVLKKDRSLLLFQRGKEIRRYKIALGGDPLGPKARQGDHKTPEGIYSVDGKIPHSQFHKALHVSYPSEAD